jgi:hypothetical protein
LASGIDYYGYRMRYIYVYLWSFLKVFCVLNVWILWFAQLSYGLVLRLTGRPKPSPLFTCPEFLVHNLCYGPAVLPLYEHPPLLCCKTKEWTFLAFFLITVPAPWLEKAS